jgi:hypothetical protein
MTGFYKNDNGNLLRGPNFVLNANYHLTKETKDDHTYPVDGWYWFDTEEEAREFLGIPVEEEESELDEYGNPIE